MSFGGDSDGFGGGLKGVIIDPDFIEPINLYRGGSTGDDGRGVLDFDSPVEMDVLLTSPDAAPFEIERLGAIEDIAYALCVMLDMGVTEGDRIEPLDPGYHEQYYVCREPEITNFDGEGFVWFVLYPDERGEEIDAPDEPDDSSSPNDDDLLR